MKKRILFLFMAFLAVTYVLTQEKTEELTLKVCNVKRGSIANVIEASGEAVVKDKYLITSRINGIVENVCLSIGDEVKKGQTVIKLDDSSYREKLSDIDIEKEKYESELILEAMFKGNGEKKSSAYSFAQGVGFELTNYNGMFKEADMERLSREEEQSFDLRKNEIQKIIDQCTLTSAKNGEISEIYVTAGSAVSAGQPVALITGSTTDTLSVTLSPDESENIVKGMKVSVFKKNSLYVILGTVDSIRNVSAENGYKASIIEINTEEELIPGSEYDVSFTVSNSLNTLTVPVEAVLNEYVYCIGNDNTVEEKKVNTGITDYSRIEITKGAEEGQKLILNAREYKKMTEEESRR